MAGAGGAGGSVVAVCGNGSVEGDEACDCGTDAGNLPAGCLAENGAATADCALDCTSVALCTVANATPQTSPSEYIVSAVRVPTSAAEAQNVGVDLDGDDVIDNKMGQILTLFVAGGTDPNIALNQGILDGESVMLIRIYVDQFPTDDTVVGQLLEGAVPTAPPALDGSDVRSIAAGSPTDLAACGTLTSGDVDAGPGNLWFPAVLAFGAGTWIDVDSARMVGGAATAADLTDLMVGGAMTPAQVDSVLVPAAAGFLNGEITADPNGSVAQAAHPVFDAQCSDAVEGCSAVVNGAGECTQDPTGDPGPWITETEIRCNSFWDVAIAPDLDLDDDGTNDALGIGMRLNAVRADIQ